MAEETTGQGLPKFDASKIYLIKGDTLNVIMDQIKRSRVRIITGGGLKIDHEGADGIYLSVDGTTCSLS